MERQAKDGTFYKQIGQDQWQPITRTAKDGTVYKKIGPDAWTSLEQPKPKRQPELPLGEEPNIAKAALDKFSKSMSFGYDLPIMAKGDELIERAGNVFSDEQTDPNFYEKRLAELQERRATLEEMYPKTSIASEIAGYVMPGAAVAKGAKAAVGGIKALPSVAKGATIAATEGAAMAGLQRADSIEEKMQNAAWGALTGAGFSGLGKGMEKVGGFLKEHAKALRIKGIGSMLRDFRTIYERGEIDKLNKFVKSNKILKPGSSVETVVKKTKPLVQKIGKELDEVYQGVKKTLDDSDFIDSLTPKQQDRYYEVGFYPGSNKEDAVKYVMSKIKTEQGASGAIKQIENYLDQIVSEVGDDIGIKKAQQVKSAVDRVINYARNPRNPDPIKEQAFKHLRTFINNKIKAQVQFVDDVIGGEQAKKLAQLNNDYGSAAKILDISSDRVARDASNRIFGLSEQIATGALGAGALAKGEDPETALILSGLGFLASKGAKKFGPSMGAPLMELGSNVLQSGATAAKAAALPAAGMVAQEPKKGREKWAQDGFSKFVNDLPADAQDIMIQNQRDILADKRLKRKFIEFSRMKPGSKMYEQTKSKLLKEFK